MLKKQYKRKALACHPDKNTNDRRAGEKFVALTKAYRKLLEKYSPQQVDLLRKVMLQNYIHVIHLHALLFFAKKEFTLNYYTKDLP